ncbi:hypothetical protein CDL15_Pgr005347 [Punica granatum]|uniref:Glycosyltransferase N-terminal domain-containing protein n=1 Tax=Punica granatum TaxID=22663 RepID=A0A218XDC3_PUNGR|nr:hypothetical protein CDL15_Pgr005347 [Punica granatum]
MEPPRSAHVLIVPYPAQGHMNPMLQFSKRLISKGLKATLATTISITSSMHASAQPSFPIETFSDGYDVGGFALAESTGAYLASLQSVGSETLTALIERLDRTGCPVDAVIYDGFLPWVLDVAKRLGKLAAVFFTQSCAVNSVYYHVQRGLLQVPLRADAMVELPGMPPLRPEETPSFVYAYGSYPAFATLIIGQFSNVDRADFVLFCSFYELEAEVVDWIRAKLWPSARTVGPTIPSLYLDGRLQHDTDYGIDLFKPNSAACMGWLCRKGPGSVVYVSFGSMAELGPVQMAELASALKNSGYQFLWIVRSTEMPKLPPGFTAETANQGLVMTWCPQLQVLLEI